LHSAAQGPESPRSILQKPIQTTSKIENMFGRLKDWRRIATRYDRRADIFMAAIIIAAIVIWWIQ
jgi:hypothetical protein